MRTCPSLCNIESMIRRTTSMANMHLRQFVQKDDVIIATRVTVEFFIDTQNFSVMKSMKKAFSWNLT